MDTILMNFENSKTSDSGRLLLIPSNIISLQQNDKYVAISNFRIYYAWKNIKKSYKNNRLKKLLPKWNKKFELSDGSYSISDIQYYFKYIIKKHEALTDNPPNRIFVWKNKNRIPFEIKTGYYIELLTPKTTLKC